MVNKSKFCLIIGLSILSLVFTLSCKKNRVLSDSGADTLLQKKVTFPDELKPITPGTVTSMASFRSHSNGKHKIVSVVDGTCASCIVDQLNQMDKTFQEINGSGSAVMVFIVNVTKNDSAYFMLNMQPLIDAKGFVLIDHSYNFEKTNRLFTTDANLRTFLINDQGNILTYGNPLMNPDLLNNYQTLLQ